ncbi:MAG: substrate-binding domain-containing protein, partial [Planctomycetota bacterium JB042]
MRAPRLLVPLLVALATLAACSRNGGGDGAAERPKVAFVTNGIASFWTIANAGVRAAAEEFDVDAEFETPANGIVDQKRIVEELLTLGVDGIAISPIDGVNQAGLIDEACERTHVVTHDSDAPGTKRLCYVGMDNYEAGRACGKLLKEAMPDGGSVMLFVGRMEQDNAKLRRQGIVDELLDRPADRTRFDPPG